MYVIFMFAYATCTLEKDKKSNGSKPNVKLKLQY